MVTGIDRLKAVTILQSPGNSLGPEKAEESQRVHLPALDGLRGIAILLVLLNHTSALPFAHYAGLRSAFSNLVSSTGYGVQLFFVLSGFLITGILLDSKDSEHYFRNFYARRVLRIFPLYYGTLVVFWLAVRFHGFEGDSLFLHRLPWLLTYTSNVLITLRRDWSFIFGQHSLGHFWSLAVEEQFYFVWPAIILWCSPKMLKKVCLSAIALGFASRIYLLYPRHNLLGSIVFLSCQLDALAIGALLAILVRERREIIAAVAWPMAGLSAAIWIASCADMDLLVTVGMTGFSLMSAGLLAMCLQPGASFFTNRPLRAFGRYSYAIYVLHVILLPFILPLRTKLNPALFTCFFIALSFAAGWLSWHLYEVHFLRLKRFFPSGVALPKRLHRELLPANVNAG